MGSNPTPSAPRSSAVRRRAPRSANMYPEQGKRPASRIPDLKSVTPAVTPGVPSEGRDTPRVTPGRARLIGSDGCLAGDLRCAGRPTGASHVACRAMGSGACAGDPTAHRAVECAAAVAFRAASPSMLRSLHRRASLSCRSGGSRPSPDTAVRPSLAGQVPGPRRADRAQPRRVRLGAFDPEQVAAWQSELLARSHRRPSPTRGPRCGPSWRRPEPRPRSYQPRQPGEAADGAAAGTPGAHGRRGA